MVHTDPTALRSFSQQLSRFTTRIEDIHSSLHTDLSRLGDTWQDDQYSEFCDLFGQMTHLLATFTPTAVQSVADLNADADIIEAAQRTPFNR